MSSNRLAPFVPSIVSIVLGACSSGSTGGASPTQGDQEFGGYDDTTGDGAPTGSSTCPQRAAAAYALSGLVITPDGAIDGFVVIENEKIKAVTQTRPTDMNVVDTNGIIAPG